MQSSKTNNESSDHGYMWQIAFENMRAVNVTVSLITVTLVATILFGKDSVSIEFAEHYSFGGFLGSVLLLAAAIQLIEVGFYLSGSKNYRHVFGALLPFSHILVSGGLCIIGSVLQSHEARSSDILFPFVLINLTLSIYAAMQYSQLVNKIRSGRL